MKHTIILKESELKQIISKTVRKVLKETISWDDIRKHNIKKDFDWDGSYINYGEDIPWEKKRKDIILAIKRSFPFQPQNQQDISINRYGDIAFISPFSSDCKEYLYSVKPDELWEVIEELKNTSDGYEFLLEKNGYIVYVRQHNGFWY